MSQENQQLSPGAIAGIAAGVAGAVSFAIYCWLRRRFRVSKAKNENPTPQAAIGELELQTKECKRSVSLPLSVSISDPDPHARESSTILGPSNSTTPRSTVISTSSPRGSGGMGSDTSQVHTPRGSNDAGIEIINVLPDSPQEPLQTLAQTPDAAPLMPTQDRSIKIDILTPPESPSEKKISPNVVIEVVELQPVGQVSDHGSGSPQKPNIDTNISISPESPSESPLPEARRHDSVSMGRNSAGFFEQKPKPKTSRPRQQGFEKKQQIQAEEKRREAKARAELQRNTKELMEAWNRNAEQQKEANVLAERFAVERKKFIAIHEERELVKEFKEAVINSRIQFSILNAEPLGSITNKFNHQANIVKNLIVVGLNILKKNIEEEFKELGVRLFMEGVDDPGLRIEKLKALGHRLEKLENIAQDVDAYMADKRAKEHKAESVDLQDETFAAALALVDIDSMDQDTQTGLTAGMGW